jgi:hypothetical protein
MPPQRAGSVAAWPSVVVAALQVRLVALGISPPPGYPARVSVTMISADVGAGVQTH